YLLDSLARVAAPGYIPTDSDIILCSLPPPSPITEMPFSYPDQNSLPPTLVRVRHSIGLQRKWIHLFSDAEAIIFIVDLTCYDQTIYSADTDEYLNRMRETMRQFESVCNFPGMASRTAILVMNKFDLFTEKLATVPFTECFPKYDGPNEAHAAATYCIEPFTHLSSASGWRDPMEVRGWCTNALDAEQMRGALEFQPCWESALMLMLVRSSPPRDNRVHFTVFTKPSSDGWVIATRTHSHL
ncbi:guanine nucleotide binding protein, alpha subunit, partial [Mycena leptocephala]